MSLDAFAIEVANRLRSIPLGGDALAEFARICDDVRNEWREHFPEALAACEREMQETLNDR